jgi:hypothetical protein
LINSIRWGKEWGCTVLRSVLGAHHPPSGKLGLYLSTSDKTPFYLDGVDQACLVDFEKEEKNVFFFKPPKQVIQKVMVLGIDEVRL